MLTAQIIARPDPSVGTLMITVAVFTAALAVIVMMVLIYGPPFLRVCRDLFRPAYVRKAQEHDARRIPETTPRAHEDDAVRRRQLNALTKVVPIDRQVH